MQRSQTRWFVGLIAVMVPLLGGCGLFGGDGGGAAPVTGASQPPDGSGDTADLTGDGLRMVAARLQAQAGDDADPVPVDEELPVVATRTGTNAAETYEVDLNGVLVQGRLMTVVFTVRSTSDGLLGLASVFDDGVSQPDPGGSPASTPNSFSTDGVYVLDPVNARRHLAAYDATGRCVCSTALNVTGLGPDAQVVLATVFTAPPDDVETVEVGIPSAGVFSAVPVTR